LVLAPIVLFVCIDCYIFLGFIANAPQLNENPVSAQIDGTEIWGQKPG